MNVEQAIQAACLITGDKPEAVLAYHLGPEGNLSMVVDRGIKGGPKFDFTLTQLQDAQAPAPVVMAEPPPKPTGRRK